MTRLEPGGKAGHQRWMAEELGWLRPYFVNQVERTVWILQELFRAVILRIA
jgi:hypothetical protein